MPRCCVSVAASQGVGEMFSSCLHKHQLPSSLIDRESSQHPPLISVKPGNPSFPLFYFLFCLPGRTGCSCCIRWDEKRLSTALSISIHNKKEMSKGGDWGGGDLLSVGYRCVGAIREKGDGFVSSFTASSKSNHFFFAEWQHWLENSSAEVTVPAPWLAQHRLLTHRDKWEVETSGYLKTAEEDYTCPPPFIPQTPQLWYG